MDPTAVTGLFSNNGTGIANTLVTQIDGYISAQGTLERQSTALGEAASAIDRANTLLASSQTFSPQRQARHQFRLSQSLNTYQNIYSMLMLNKSLL